MACEGQLLGGMAIKRERGWEGWGGGTSPGDSELKVGKVNRENFFFFFLVFVSHLEV